MDSTIEPQARAGLRPHAPAVTRPFGVLLNPNPLTVGPFSLLQATAVGVSSLLIGALVAAYIFLPLGVLLGFASASLLIKVYLTASAFAQQNWLLWWQVYVTSSKAAGVSKVITKPPAPAWFEITDDAVLLSFTPTSPSVRDPGTKHGLEKDMAAVWEKNHEGTIALWRWNTPTQLLVWAADPKDPQAQRSRWVDELVYHIHQAAGQTSTNRAKYLDIEVHGDPGNVDQITIYSTTTKEVCPRYQRDTFEKAVHTLLQVPANKKVYWKWDDPLTVTATITEPTSAQAQSTEAAAAVLAELGTKLAYKKSQHLDAVTVPNWENGPTQVCVHLKNLSDPAQVTRVLGIQVRPVLFQLFPDRAWLPGTVVAAQSGIVATYQALPASAEQSVAANKHIRMEHILDQGFTSDDFASFDSASTSNNTTTAIFTVHTKSFVNDRWRERTENNILQTLPGSTVHWDLPTSRVAITW